MNNNKLIVSIDVEDWYHGPKVISANNRKVEDLRIKIPSCERGFMYIDRCLELLSLYNIKATFFWVAEYAKKYPHYFQKTVDAGHEIACHGLHHYSKVNRVTKEDVFTPQEFYRRTREAKDILEQMSGKQVLGYRAPNAYISGKIIDVLEELGFRYDSSVSRNSMYNKTSSSLQGVSSHPYYPMSGEICPGQAKRGIIEFPWPYFEIGGYKIQTAGGPFLRIFGATLIKLGLRQSLHRGHSVFYFHPMDFIQEDLPIQMDWKWHLFWWPRGKIVVNRVDHILKEFQSRATNFELILQQISQSHGF